MEVELDPGAVEGQDALQDAGGNLGHEGLVVESVVGDVAQGPEDARHVGGDRVEFLPAALVRREAVLDGARVEHAERRDRLAERLPRLVVADLAELVDEAEEDLLGRLARCRLQVRLSDLVRLEVDGPERIEQDHGLVEPLLPAGRQRHLSGVPGGFEVFGGDKHVGCGLGSKGGLGDLGGEETGANSETDRRPQRLGRRFIDRPARERSCRRNLDMGSPEPRLVLSMQLQDEAGSDGPAPALRGAASWEAAWND